MSEADVRFQPRGEGNVKLMCVTQAGLTQRPLQRLIASTAAF